MTATTLRVLVATALVVGFLAAGFARVPKRPVTPFTGEGVPCEVTTPNGYRVAWATIGASPEWHGTNGLSTTLWPDGTVIFRRGGPGAELPDGSLRMKFLWFKTRQPLSIEGRRLDEPGPPLGADIDHAFDGADFQPSAIVFRSPGCWEVKAQAGDAALTFVTRVIRLGSPSRPRR